MKLTSIILFALLSSWSLPNKPVERVDIKQYAGVWYSLYSIPTIFDKNTRETTGFYTWNPKGYYDVVTSYKKGNDEDIHSVKSKVFQVAGTNNAQMEAQFLWPYKVDYWVIELADDYSYVVVGHPEYKYLFIMSRRKALPPKQLDEIMARCKARGYPVEKLVSQQHDK
ncbi:lipocalin family protein [Flectobacillus major]|jgi:apolipoprotein D and lipocalin family protein|uniref:lipocalin family protein n=1 Tax=Flectobacillus major TaxID=103 RepID=UPI00040252F6|nr:lipocalin family protein [Flectobacillus major]